MKYLALDTETFGIPKEVTLLTAWFGIFDEKFNKIAELDLRLKPTNGIYVGQPKALDINKIDLYEHDRIAIDYKKGGTLLYNFLRNNNLIGQEKYIVVGHNTVFDVQKVTENLISRESWEQFCSYRLLDTATIAQFLIATGILPNTLEAGLGKLVKYFEVEVVGELHTAKADTMATMEVFKQLRNLVNRG